MELASATGGSNASSNPTPSNFGSPFTDAALSPSGHSADGHHAEVDNLANSPLVLPGTRQSAAELEVPELVLDKAATEVDKESRKTI